MLKPKEYIERSAQHNPKFSKAFYELSFERKCMVFNRLVEQNVLLNREGEIYNELSLYNRCILALLQHSTDIKKEYPVEGERKVSPVARNNDWIDFMERIASALPTVVIPNG